MGLLTNLVALVKKTGSPLGKVFFHRRGTRRGSWRHGRGSAVRHQRHPPSFAWSGFKLWRGETRFARVLLVDQPRTR